METIRSGKVQAEEMRIRVPWGEIAAKCWNCPRSQPVLVVHGLCENAGSFDRLVPFLSKEFYFVAVDLPGHGWSSSLPRGLALDFMHFVGQLVRVVEHFGWSRVWLIGHSFGGHLAQFFAATYPNTVVKVILLDAVSPTPVPRDVFLLFHRNRTKEAILLETGGSEAKAYTYEEALSHVAHGRLSKLIPEAARALLNRGLVRKGSKFVFTTDPRTRSEIKPAIDEDMLLQQLGRIKCPVLVVLAEESEHFQLLNCPGYYSTALDILKQSHGSSTVVRVPGNHCVHNNQPEVIAPILNKFLSHPQCKV